MKPQGEGGGANIEQQINVSLFHKPYISLDCLLLDSRKSATRMTMLYTIANLWSIEKPLEIIQFIFFYFNSS